MNGNGATKATQDNTQHQPQAENQTAPVAPATLVDIQNGWSGFIATVSDRQAIALWLQQIRPVEYTDRILRFDVPDSSVQELLQQQKSFVESRLTAHFLPAPPAALHAGCARPGFSNFSVIAGAIPAKEE